MNSILPDYHSIILEDYYSKSKIFKRLPFFEINKKIKLFEQISNINFNESFLQNIETKRAFLKNPTNCLYSGYDNIFILPEGNALFSEEVIEALSAIHSQPIGNRLLRALGQRGNPIYIFEGSTDAACEKLGVVILSLSSLKSLGKNGENIPFPFFTKLAHELIHIHQDAKTNKSLPLTPDHLLIWTNEIEYRAIMRGSDLSPDITENAIRKEHGLPERYSHLFPANLSPHIRNLVKEYAQQW